MQKKEMVYGYIKKRNIYIYLSIIKSFLFTFFFTESIKMGILFSQPYEAVYTVFITTDTDQTGFAGKSFSRRILRQKKGY